MTVFKTYIHAQTHTHKHKRTSKKIEKLAKTTTQENGKNEERKIEQFNFYHWMEIGRKITSKGTKKNRRKIALYTHIYFKRLHKKEKKKRKLFSFCRS